jgi:hypothetical protein
MKIDPVPNLTPESSPPHNTAGSGSEERERFVWESLVPHLIEPTKLTIIRTLLRKGQPLTPEELAKDGESKEELVRYQCKAMEKAGVLAAVDRAPRPGRGGEETSYFFPEPPQTISTTSPHRGGSPNARIVISRPHRDALYHETVIDLAGVEDLRRELESADPDLETCEQIARRTTDALRLIQDGGLGWGHPDQARSDTDGDVELVLPAEELRQVILDKRKILAQAAQMRQREREGQEWEWEQLDTACEACSSILDQLGGQAE